MRRAGRAPPRRGIQGPSSPSWSSWPGASWSESPCHQISRRWLLSARFSPPRWRRRLWPHEAVEGAALALGRAARTALAYEDPRHSLHDRDRRTVVDQACRRHRSPDPLIDDGDHLKDARALYERLDSVADLHRGRRLGWRAVHADVAAPATRRRGSA